MKRRGANLNTKPFAVEVINDTKQTESAFNLAQHTHDLGLRKSALPHQDLLVSHSEKIKLPKPPSQGEDYRGVALLRAKKALEGLKSANADVQAGINIVSRAIESPIRQIVENAGVEGSIVGGKLLERDGNWGFNAQTEEYVDMVKAGIIDPTKVVRIGDGCRI